MARENFSRCSTRVAGKSNIMASTQGPTIRKSKR